MKFHTVALAAALLAPKVNSQNVTNGNFTFVGSYEFPSALGAYLGGGSIVNDKLLLIVNAEESDAYLGSVPVLRNCKLSTLAYASSLSYSHDLTKRFMPFLFQCSYHRKDHWV